VIRLERDGHVIKNIYTGSIEAYLGDYTPGRYTWILANVKALATPIPEKGHQGFWDVELAEVI
jgi:hypothetical protein